MSVVSGTYQSRLDSGPRPGVHSSRPAVLALVAVLSFGVSASVAAYLWSGRIEWVLGALAAVAPIILMMPIGLARRGYDMFEPMSFVLLSVLIGVTARTFLIVLDDSPESRMYFLLGESLDVLMPGLAVVIFGLMCLSFGYLMRLPRLPLQRLRNLDAEISERKLAVVMVPLVIVSAFCVVKFMQATGGWESVLVGSISNKRTVAVAGGEHWTALGYYRWGAKLAAFLYCFALAMLIPRKLSRAPLWLVTTGVLGLLGVLLPFLSSSRRGTLLLIVITAIIVHYGRSRLTIRQVLVTGAIALSGFAIMGLLRAEARNVTRQADEGLLGTIEGTIGTRHWLGIDKTSLIIDAVPTSLPHELGTTLVAWMAAPIPRTIWREKPVIRPGPIVASEIYGLNSLTTGVPPGIVGELYWNFGFFGVGLGMFVLGTFLRLAYRSFEPLLVRGRSGAIVLYTTTVVPLSLQLPGSDTSGAVIELLTAAVPTFVILALVAKRRTTVPTRAWPHAG